MTVHTLSKFTPEVLLSAPRRSPGIPNTDGSKVLYSVSSYSFEKHEKSSEIRVLDVKTSESSLIDDSAKCSNPVWMDDETIALLRSADEDRTELLIGSPEKFKKNFYVAGTIEAPVDNLKVARLGPKLYGIAVSAASNPDGTLYSPSKAKKPHSSGKLYRSLFVRHWDTWITRQRVAIWYGSLSIEENNGDPSIITSPRYTISPLQNALQGTALESPIPPFGGADNFDVSRTGLIFIAKDQDLDPALNTKCKLYLVPLTTFLEKMPAIIEIPPPPIMQGAMTSPVFSKHGSSAAFLMMRENGYESDKNELLVIPDVKTPAWIIHMLNRDNPKRDWDRSPTSVAWAPDNARLFLLAEDDGRKQLFSISSDPKIQMPPQPHASLDGSIDDVKILASSATAYRLFMSSTSMVENSAYSLLTLSQSQGLYLAPKQDTISALSGNGAKLGLHSSQISEIRTPRASKARDSPKAVHSWVVKPSGFDPKKKYPLAFLIHGGPQGSWMNSWSTRWNPAVFAEQGYVVVCPNPTGSTGYGQGFTDAIKEQWGGLPYEDLVKCFEYIEKQLDYVDTTRAVALGASYGGYMVNWIQGQDLGRKFKALVTHDGVFSTAYELATEELYFIEREFGGPWSTNREKYLKWSPDQFTQNWKTPHLIIHSEKDYRLTISDGLAAFSILQSRNVESEFLTFPEENHWVIDPENSLVWHETVLNFINDRVGLPLYKQDDDKEIIQDPPRPQHTAVSTTQRLTVAR